MSKSLKEIIQEQKEQQTETIPQPNCSERILTENHLAYTNVNLPVYDHLWLDEKGLQSQFKTVSITFADGSCIKDAKIIDIINLLRAYKDCKIVYMNQIQFMKQQQQDDEC